MSSGISDGPRSAKGGSRRRRGPLYFDVGTRAGTTAPVRTSLPPCCRAIHTLSMRVFEADLGQILAYLCMTFFYGDDCRERCRSDPQLLAPNLGQKHFLPNGAESQVRQGYWDDLKSLIGLITVAHTPTLRRARVGHVGRTTSQPGEARALCWHVCADACILVGMRQHITSLSRFNHIDDVGHSLRARRCLEAGPPKE
ncbi:hypothetical protein EVAR_67222_1 [Eumeta japonica]|uniref:Uncharacterized protein n=1 Tax=Eumeta variegata TaxID=151549 RepID=A0A4C2A7L3_EUMVA|nr:hypothetical protein EVAR_67222_1 [Eumeta japonica]